MRFAVLALAFSASCASTVVAVEERAVHDEFEQRTWRPAEAADLAGEWRATRIQGPAAAVLMDVSYWLDSDGCFSGAALFVGPPPTFEVLAGRWMLGEGGALTLGEEAEPAKAEVSGALLRLSGADGSLVFERVEVQ